MMLDRTGFCSSTCVITDWLMVVKCVNDDAARGFGRLEEEVMAGWKIGQVANSLEEFLRE